MEHSILQKYDRSIMMKSQRRSETNVLSKKVKSIEREVTSMLEPNYFVE